MQFYPLLFEENLFTRVWGGHRIRPLKGLPADDEKIGESWEISAVPGKESIVSNGPLAGQTLAQLVEKYPGEMLGSAVAERFGGHFPLLFKILDSEDNLSIQVHPNDQLAMQRHNSLGKTEIWYVIDAKPGAFLYCGFALPTTPQAYERHVANGTITEILKKHYVNKGDVFFIPAGRVHAIGAGLLLAEIQESSDITYRIYDYDRPGLDGKPRQLHTAEARDAIDYTFYPEYRTNYEELTNKPALVAQCPYFTIKIHNVNRPFHRKLYKYQSFVAYVCIDGNCFIESATDEVQSVHLRKGHTCLVPAAAADINIVPDNLKRRTKILEIYIESE